MSTLPDPAPSGKPEGQPTPVQPSWSWIRPVVFRSMISPGYLGLLEIDGVTYGCQPASTFPCPISLQREDGTVYQVDPTQQPWSCSCEALGQPGTCIHVLALREALAALFTRPTPEWAWLRQPRFPSRRHFGRHGWIRIDGVLHAVIPLGPFPGLLQVMAQGEEDVTVDCRVWTCTCEDASRPGGCLHVLVLREALAAIGHR
jgi:hypothetical protein